MALGTLVAFPRCRTCCCLSHTDSNEASPDTPNLAHCLSASAALSHRVVQNGQWTRARCYSFYALRPLICSLLFSSFPFSHEQTKEEIFTAVVAGMFLKGPRLLPRRARQHKRKEEKLSMLQACRHTRPVHVPAAVSGLDANESHIICDEIRPNIEYLPPCLQDTV